jgi:hypothetical protein
MMRTARCGSIRRVTALLCVGVAAMFRAWDSDCFRSASRGSSLPEGGNDFLTRGARSSFSEKKGGEDFFQRIKRGPGLFFREKKGARTFFG